MEYVIVDKESILIMGKTTTHDPFRTNYCKLGILDKVRFDISEILEFIIDIFLEFSKFTIGRTGLVSLTLYKSKVYNKFNVELVKLSMLANYLCLICNFLSDGKFRIESF